MSRASLFRISFWMAVCIALAITPQNSFAQHGGRGGGGFHGGGFASHGGGFAGHGGGFAGHGGGFAGFHGGGGFGGFHNGSGFGGFHNGPGFLGVPGRGFPGSNRSFHGGFRGAYGYPYGATFNFGFAPYWGISPYWGAYPYFYSPWWPAPYYAYPYSYPYDSDPGDDRCGQDCDNRGKESCIPDYRHEDRCNDSSPDNSQPKRESAPTPPSSTGSSPTREYVSVSRETAYRTSLHPVAWRSASRSDLELASSSTRAAPIRPAVENSIQALRAMPPDARRRQLRSDRYADFSPEERELLDQASQPDVTNSR